MNPLNAFAEEVAHLADQVGDYRFKGAEGYITDVDELRRRLRDITDRMRRAASEKPIERPTIFSSGPVVSDRGRLVRVERRRIRPRR